MMPDDPLFNIPDDVLARMLRGEQNINPPSPPSSPPPAATGSASSGGTGGSRFNSTYGQQIRELRRNLNLPNRQSNRTLSAARFNKAVAGIEPSQLQELVNYSQNNPDFDEVLREAYRMKTSNTKGFTTSGIGEVGQQGMLLANKAAFLDTLTMSNDKLLGGKKNTLQGLVKGLKDGFKAEKAYTEFIQRTEDQFKVTGDAVDAVNGAVRDTNLKDFEKAYSGAPPKAPKVKVLSPNNLSGLSELDLMRRMQSNDPRVSVPAQKEDIYRNLDNIKSYTPEVSSELDAVRQVARARKSPQALTNLAGQVDELRGMPYIDMKSDALKDMLSEENVNNLRQLDALDPNSVGKRYRTSLERVGNIAMYQSRYGMKRGMFHMAAEMLPQAGLFAPELAMLGVAGAGVLGYEGLKAYGTSNLSNLATMGIGNTGGVNPFAASLLTGMSTQEYLQSARSLALVQRPGQNVNNTINNTGLMSLATGLSTPSLIQQQVQLAQLGGSNWNQLSKYLTAGSGQRFSATHAQAAFNAYMSMGIAPSENQLVDMATTFNKNPQVASMMPAIASSMQDPSKLFALGTLSGMNPNDLINNPALAGQAGLKLFGSGGMFGFGGNNPILSSMISQQFGYTPQQTYQMQKNPNTFLEGYDQLQKGTDVFTQLQSTIDASNAQYAGQLQHGHFPLLSGLLDKIDVNDKNPENIGSPVYNTLQRIKSGGDLSQLSSLKNASDAQLQEYANKLEANQKGYLGYKDTDAVTSLLGDIRDGLNKQNQPGQVDYSVNKPYTDSSALPFAGQPKN